MNKKANVREWMFRALMFEAESEKFKHAGIQVGADSQKVEKTLMEEVLNPFPIEIRNEALKMSRLYAQLNCFENSVRELVKERLIEEFDIDWWEKGVAKKVQEFAKKRFDVEQKNTWLEGQKSELIQFIEFGHLSDIMLNKWDLFSDLIPSQHWLKQRLDELEKSRNYIAHNRLLLPSEFKRIELYIKDWNRTIGF